MKKAFFIFPLFLFLLAIQATQAQTPEHVRRNVIKTSPIAMLQGPIIGFSEYRLVYERALTPYHAIQFSAAYLGSGVFDAPTFMDFSFANPYVKETYFGYRGTFAYKFYLDGYAPTGWYLMPMGSYSYGKISSSYDPPTDYIDATYINATINLGYQILVGERFAMDFFTGMGWKSNTWKGYGQYAGNPSLPKQATAAKFNLGMNFGVAF